jgi:predicted RNase H-like HicB family nuclease
MAVPTQVQSQAQSLQLIDRATPVEEIEQRLSEVDDRVRRALHYEPDPVEVRFGRPLPVQLINKYAMLVANHAETERLKDGSWYAEAQGFPGVWAQGDSEREAIRQLETVVRDWALLKIQDKDEDLPVVGLIDLNRL